MPYQRKHNLGVYLGIPAILSTLQAADLPVHPGTWPRNPISCGTRGSGLAMRRTGRVGPAGRLSGRTSRAAGAQTQAIMIPRGTKPRTSATPSWLNVRVADLVVGTKGCPASALVWVMRRHEAQLPGLERRTMSSFDRQALHRKPSATTTLRTISILAAAVGAMAVPGSVASAHALADTGARTRGNRQRTGRGMPPGHAGPPAVTKGSE